MDDIVVDFDQLLIIELDGSPSVGPQCSFSNGYGSTLGERIFVIGHMCEHDVESIKALTEAVEDGL